MNKNDLFNHIIDRVELLDSIDDKDDRILRNLSALVEYIWVGENEYLKGATQSREFKFNKVKVKVLYE